MLPITEQSLELDDARQEIASLKDVIVSLQTDKPTEESVGRKAWRRFRFWVRAAVIVSIAWATSLVTVLALGLPTHVVGATWAGLTLVVIAWIVTGAIVVYNDDDPEFRANHVCKPTACPWEDFDVHQKLAGTYRAAFDPTRRQYER